MAKGRTKRTVKKERSAVNKTVKVIDESCTSEAGPSSRDDSIPSTSQQSQVQSSVFAGPVYFEPFPPERTTSTFKPEEKSNPHLVATLPRVNATIQKVLMRITPNPCTFI